MSSRRGLPTKLFQVLHESHRSMEEKIQLYIKEVSEENGIKGNGTGKNALGHYLKTYSEYKNLSKKQQVDYVLDFFRSKVGYTLIHEMFLTQQVAFIGKINPHDKEVNNYLKFLASTKTWKKKETRNLLISFKVHMSMQQNIF